ncbi:MAG: Na(+)-translocating NADH-quinone reductase subunit A [Saprospirales bacterium]|nr:Na(+)-translocating NADH-quinone reductase subunit A [Saprospirales bacterium]
MDADNIIRLRKGYNILLDGEAAPKVEATKEVKTYALQPPNFPGMSPIPKLLVEEGQIVKAGDPLFFEKLHPDVQYVAPVSGEVIATRRGPKRAITEIVILADKQIQYRELEAFDYNNRSREDLVRFLLANGGWPHIRQRPFNVLASTDEVPANIFISTFDTAPLAPDLNHAVNGREKAFQTGLDVLGKLTSGKVYLGLNAAGAPAKAFTEAKNVELRWFKGKHPAGNVGVQIHHVEPISPQRRVWTLGVQDVITLGGMFSERRYNAERVVALTGSELTDPKYVRTYLGANLSELLGGNTKGENLRVISGDVLSGEKKDPAQFLNFYDDQITVAQEGNYYEMFGWLLPLKLRPSVSRTFPNFLLPGFRFRADTNTHGEKRAFVMTGQYEEVLPMDIFPQYLFKAILASDFEKMEGLGIYELVEEDVALCEFVCTSKQPLQEILRQGLDMMQEQS